MTKETLFHATTLTNFALGFDKYARTYDKGLLPRNTYPSQFFLLSLEEIGIGLEKARGLRHRLAVPGDLVVVMQTEVDSEKLHNNVRTGLGRYIEGSCIEIKGLMMDTADGLRPLVIEDALACALALNHDGLKPYAQLQPRSMSVLPVARACQAKCKFCYSEASASVEQPAAPAFLKDLDKLCLAAKARGAERFVISGGGEPGLLKHGTLVDVIAKGHQHFGKVVLITNGIHLSRQPDSASIKARLADYATAGLTRLAVSRHHHDSATNAAIMGVDTRTERILANMPEGSAASTLRPRLICVLQQGGIASIEDVEQYLRWAVSQNVAEVCFKELYVSTALESVHAGKAENEYSRAHQVPLSVLIEALRGLGFQQVSTLPWGAPVYRGELAGATLNVAAYTEPSVFWERKHGIARSWNLMADGSCLASLEDSTSAINEAAGCSTRQAIPILELKSAR